MYEVVPLEEELASVCLCVTAKYNVDDEDKLTGFGKDIYFFEDGTVVFWNIPGTLLITFFCANRELLLILWSSI